MSEFKIFNGKTIGALEGANISLLSPIVAKWEGGYVDDPTDKGGATNMGITIGTWKLLGYDKNGDGKIDKADMKLLSKQDFSLILRKYWDKWKADEILNQSVANILVDWYWASGKWGIVIPQRILGLEQDGVVGPKTLGVVNSKDPAKLFKMIKDARIKFVTDIAVNSLKAFEKNLGRKATEKEKMTKTQYKFLAGWLNRLDDFKFKE